MFVGHYSAAFVAKRIAPQIPLPIYFLTCQVIDYFWSLFVLLGVEKVRIVPQITASNSLDLYFMPFTHSLPAALVWSIGVACLYGFAVKRDAQRIRTAFLLGAVVGSHWVFDFFVHRPDLPLWYDSFKVGLGLWNFKMTALALELALVWASVIFALKISGASRSRYILLGVALSLFQIVSLFLAPATDISLALQLLGSYSFLTLLSYWADHKRIAPELSTRAA